jgi:NAD(P)-dependent dehydrogenase (short-subunit alcohol dehydrogenase family)
MRPEEDSFMGDRLKGKVAIVTGAGAVIGAPDRPPVGNGRAAAMVFAKEGAALLAVDTHAESAEETRRMIEKEGGRCSVFLGDISRAADCKAMAENCVKAYGRIDILHNNVGIGPRNASGILESDEADWDRVMNVNVKGLYHTCRAVLPQMLKQGSGSILNISSVGAVLHAYPKLFIYTISKSAVNTFTRCLAAEFAPKGIRVNCIMPGMIDSPPIYKEILPLYGGDIEKMRKDRNERVPMKHMGEPWDIAYASLFLVSDEAKYITGQVLSVDGGLLLA